MDKSYKQLKTKYGNEQTFYDKVPVGTVYTPDAVSKQMVALSLETYVNKQHDGSVSFLSYDLEEKIQLMLSLTVADLACGTGQLLLAYMEVLSDLINQSCIYEMHVLKDFAENNLYGFDIDSQAIKAGHELFQAFFKADLNLNLVCCDSLTDDIPLQPKSVDIILGNPPYIGEKGNTLIFEKIKKTSWGKPYYEGKMDYFYFFIYRGYDFLKPTGVLCYLTSNYFFTADGARKLRHFIKNKFNLCAVLDYSEEAVFNKHKIHACLFALSHKKSDQVLLYNNKMVQICGIDSTDIFDTSENIRLIDHPVAFSIIEKIKAHSTFKMSDWYEVAQGLVTGADRFQKKPVFVYSNEEAEALPVEAQPYLRPLYKNSSIGHYFYDIKTSYQVLYLVSSDLPEALKEMLLPFKDHLSKRREVKNKVRNWYNLTWPRSEEIFLDEKIVVPQRAKSNYFAYSDTDFYGSADIYFIKSTFFSPYSLKVLSLLLNSNLYKLWLQHMGKKKGALLELYATPLKNLPLPTIEDQHVQQLMVYANQLYENHHLQASLRDEVEDLLMHIFALTESEKRYLKNIANI